MGCVRTAAGPLGAWGGDLEVVLGAHGATAEKARERLLAAIALAEECERYAEEAHTVPVRQAAWCILQKCIARAFQYDVRVLEPGEAKPLAAELDRVVCVEAEGERRFLDMYEHPSLWGTDEVEAALHDAWLGCDHVGEVRPDSCQPVSCADRWPLSVPRLRSSS